LAMRRSVLGLGRRNVYGSMAFGVSLLAFSQARWAWLALLIQPVAA
jgi:hypothetical protein